MDHIAVDLGSRQSHFCVRRPDGEIIEEAASATVDLDLIFRRYSPSRVLLEACTESEAVAEMAEAAGHEVVIVPSMLSRQLGVGQHGIKTDRRDAQALSAASCRMDLAGIYRRSEVSRSRLRQLNSREALVSSRTKLINVVRGYLRSQLVTLRASSSKFPQAVRERLGDVPEDIESILRVLDSLNEQIATATAAIEKQAQNDPVCRLLMTAPGVGPITSTSFAATIEDASRFPSAADVGSYLGLSPGERSSSLRKKRTGITKAGSALTRKYLTQSSLSLRRSATAGPIRDWAAAVKERRGGPVATIAVARKLSGILYAMMRDGQSYEAARSAGHNR